MITKRTARRTAAAIAATAALIAVPVASANALPIGGLGHSGAVCYYAGVAYSDGAIIMMNGAKYKCSNGTWKFFSSGVTAFHR